MSTITAAIGWAWRGNFPHLAAHPFSSFRSDIRTEISPQTAHALTWALLPKALLEEPDESKAMTLLIQRRLPALLAERIAPSPGNPHPVLGPFLPGGHR